MRLRFAIVVAGIAASLMAAQQNDAAARAARATQKPSSGTACDDITKLGVRNLTLHTAGRTFAFHNGVAENDLLEQVQVDGRMESRWDWKAEVERDTFVRPAADAVVRFLLIGDSHQFGSGEVFYLVGFRCSDGKLREVFHRQGVSLSVDRLDDTGVTVGLVEKYGDPTRKYWSYTWDGHRYVLASTH